MQFINHRTNKILRGAVQMGNRLRYEFGRFNAHETEQYTCEVKNTFGQTAKKTAYIRMEGTIFYFSSKTRTHRHIQRQCMFLCKFFFRTTLSLKIPDTILIVRKSL